MYLHEAHLSWPGTYKPSCAYSSEHESVCTHMWTNSHVHMCRHVQSCMCKLLFPYDNNWKKEGGGKSQLLHSPQYQQPWSLTVVLAGDSSHHRVCFFSLSGIDLLNITSRKESTQQLIPNSGERDCLILRWGKPLSQPALLKPEWPAGSSVSFSSLNNSCQGPGVLPSRKPVSLNQVWSLSVLPINKI